jgi:N-acetylmuramoyl-L-alanine amidase
MMCWRAVKSLFGWREEEDALEEPDMSNQVKGKVLLDAGHGGHDPGAQAGGHDEKDITLLVVQAIGWYLQNRGVEVLYTRKHDLFLSLTQRLNLIEREKPDAFVSVHCNAIADNPDTPQDEQKLVGGTEVYYRDEGDKILAASLNHYLARTDMRNRGVRQDREWLGKRLTVLNNVPVPSTLVEIGYLTNSQDRHYILANILGIGELLACGILDFLRGEEPTA